MAKKKVVYQITRIKFEMVEVDTPEQEELIKELNRDFEREDKREKTARARCISLDALYENDGYEVADSTPSSEEAYIEETEKEQFHTRLHQAIDSLTERQKEVIKKYFWEGKTFREIADELGIHFTTVAEPYQAAIKKMKKYFEKF